MWEPSQDAGYIWLTLHYTRNTDRGEAYPHPLTPSISNVLMRIHITSHHEYKSRDVHPHRLTLVIINPFGVADLGWTRGSEKTISLCGQRLFTIHPRAELRYGTALSTSGLCSVCHQPKWPSLHFRQVLKDICIVECNVCGTIAFHTSINDRHLCMLPSYCKQVPSSTVVVHYLPSQVLPTCQTTTCQTTC
jgi:hypothetical protein